MFAVAAAALLVAMLLAIVRGAGPRFMTASWQ